MGKEDDSVYKEAYFVVYRDGHLLQLRTVVVAAPIDQGVYLASGKKENTDGGYQYGRKGARYRYHE